MSLQTHAQNAHTKTPTRVEPDRGGLDNTPASASDRDLLREHLGRDVLHGSVTRDFKKAYRRNADGTNSPRMYRFDTDALGRCEYAMLTTKQYAAVLVVDVDQIGTAGGDPADLNPYVRSVVRSLITHNIGPAWVGINPTNGKAQFIWLIDPVFADRGGKSAQMKLLAATTRVLGELLDHDPHFSHRFSRNPFYTGKAPTAYRWYRQHNRVMRLGDLVKQVRDMAGHDQFNPAPRQQFSSGRELINAVKTRREQAQAFKALAQDVDAEISGGLDQYDPELIDGVRVLWIAQGTAARDETAFRHALKTGHRLRQQGQRLTDAAIIDAYEHAYNVAQAHGGAGRDNEMPPMRDRQTMARRVRGYVTQSKSDAYSGSNAPGKATSSERKALATMGRRGGKKAAERWKTDPEGKYAQERRATLSAANNRRTATGKSNAFRIAAFFADTFGQTGQYPSIPDAMEEFGVSRPTVNRALRMAGISLPRGRTKLPK
ncbi:replication initiation protein [Corynebacterium tuberculostearicum]|uniref:replication initiation protein n=1 Tax=Corynebacterium TaxID=1716 RepID=UPI001EF3C454|nr:MULTISPECIES: replication initiation protein [Corynebacterium]MCG7442484.1 replication initiation protein [Corynebacterium sp. ACRPQ]MDV2429485.1 replication initiation protein [Corynebacterium tuberculostearicum]WKE56311.1 replication initiation protein [Corynebacterium tuberculostearicum]